MSTLKSLMNNKYLLWSAFTLPLVLMVADKFINGTPGGRFFYWTGVISMVFIFVSMVATPAYNLSNGALWAKWLMKQRRYIGVAGFGYMAAHTAYWVQEVPIIRLFTSFGDPTILLGWICGIIITAMAITSNDYSVRRFGQNWKKIQRYILIGAPIALLHWFMAENFKISTILSYGLAFVIIMLLRGIASRNRGNKSEQV